MNTPEGSDPGSNPGTSNVNEQNQIGSFKLYRPPNLSKSSSKTASM